MLNARFYQPPRQVRFPRLRAAIKRWLGLYDLEESNGNSIVEVRKPAKKARRKS